MREIVEIEKIKRRNTQIDAEKLSKNIPVSRKSIKKLTPHRPPYKPASRGGLKKAW